MISHLDIVHFSDVSASSAKIVCGSQLFIITLPTWCMGRWREKFEMIFPISDFIRALSGCAAIILNRAATLRASFGNDAVGDSSKKN